MRNLLRKNSVQIVLILAVLSILYIAITPKIIRTFYPSSASHSWIEFSENVVQTRDLDPQTYWKFREFYSPGVYTIVKNGVDKSKVKTFYSKIPAEFQNQTELNFLIFDSPYLQSIDGLTNKQTLQESIDFEKLDKSNIVEQTDALLIYKLQNNKYVLISLFTPEQMKAANGFWDYQKDQEVINNRNWISTSVILP